MSGKVKLSIFRTNLKTDKQCIKSAPYVQFDPKSDFYKKKKKGRKKILYNFFFSLNNSTQRCQDTFDWNSKFANDYILYLSNKKKSFSDKKTNPYFLRTGF